MPDRQKGLAVGQLNDAVQHIEKVIIEKGLDSTQTRGLIGMKAGFFLVIINPNTPDDAVQLESLHKAAEEVLGQPMPF